MTEFTQTRFSGTERFELIAALGRGAHGVVYEAFDREQQTRVALKVLSRRSPDAILDFKNEFRALQGIRHRNLVELNELLFDEGHWLLAMELIRGVDILAYGRGALPVSGSASAVVQATPTDETLRPWSDEQPVLVPKSERARPPGLDDRIRASFDQLARGLVALHAASKIHRDLKPSNVVVDADGRVVILDFGLVADFVACTSNNNARLLGTPRYMAPEQAALEPVGPASDWYSVGVMLYEVLTGQSPFAGSGEELLANKRRSPPPLPLRLRPGAPSELSELCMALLAFDPADRPDGEQVLASISRSGVPPTLDHLPAGTAPDAIFVGRERELEALRHAFQRVSHGEPLTVIIEGESGVGKTSLVERFVQQLHATENAASSFRGRCFERESVPYKAFDAVMDGVCGYLAGLPESDAAKLLPENALAAAQAFPVLRRLERAVSPSPTVDEPIEPHAQRLSIFAALRELFVRLANARPLVVIIDDMQWSDIDSLALLSALMRPPGAPKMLLITVQRPGSPMSQIQLPGPLIGLPLGPLSGSESAALVSKLLNFSAPTGDAREIQELACEVGGHPLFLRELVRQVTEPSARCAAPLRFEDALWRRIGALDPLTRRLIELASIAGKPFAQGTMASALAMTLADDASSADERGGAKPTHVGEHIATLRHACLIRTTGPHPADAIEPYHDRVRDAVLAHLELGARKQYHRALACALQNAGTDDPEALAIHWQGAGELAHAYESAVLAAEQAAMALAFERAARLYRLSLELCPGDIRQRRALSVRLGEALANAGRGAEAAQAYQMAAEGEETVERLHLQRLAAEQLLRSGYVQRGLQSTYQVLREMGIFTPQNRVVSLLSLGLLRARIRVRGFHYFAKGDSEISALESAKIDGTWTAAICLTMFDNVRSAELQCQNTLSALRGGTPLQILRAHTAEAMFLGLGGQSNRRRIERLLAAAGELAEQLGHPAARAWVALSRGATAFFLGDWQQGQEQCAAAESVFHQRPGALFELGSARAFRVWSSMMRGEFRDVLRLVPVYVREAENRGDLYSATYQMTGFSNVAWLSKDDVPEARRMLALAEQRWPTASFDVPRYMDLMAAAHIELYDGTGATAYRRVLRDWRSLRWGVAFRAQITRFGLRFARGLAALAAYDAKRDRALLGDATACAHAIARERVVWSQCFSEILLSGIAVRERMEGKALEHLLQAEKNATATGMALHGAVARHRRGELVGGDDGRLLIAGARTFMAAQEIGRPDRMLDMLSPTMCLPHG